MDHEYFWHGQNIFTDKTSKDIFPLITNNDILFLSLPRHKGLVSSKPKTVSKTAICNPWILFLMCNQSWICLAWSKYLY